MNWKKRSFDNDEEKQSEEEQSELLSVFNIQEKPELRVTGIYGSIEEEKCSECIYGLQALHLTGQSEILSDPEDETSEKIITYQPIEFYVSTFGGLATEMFAVYDTIRSLKDMSPIHTYGLGKVMSAGVLILIHGVVAGTHGHIADIENEFAETKFTQKMYIKALATETNMTEKEIKKMVDKKTNVYIDAEEAVKLGIADIVV